MGKGGQEDGSTMPGVGFIRVKLLQVEKGDGMVTVPGEVFDPYVAVNVKEAINSPGKDAKSRHDTGALTGDHCLQITVLVAWSSLS